jgi:hypothetical protein
MLVTVREKESDSSFVRSFVRRHRHRRSHANVYGKIKVMKKQRKGVAVYSPTGV